MRDKEEYGMSDQAKDKTWGLLSSSASLPEGLSWIKIQLLTLMFCTDYDVPKDIYPYSH